MNRHSLKVLEYEQLLQKVASCAVFPGTRERLAEPAFKEQEQIQDLFDYTEEAATLLNAAGSLPLHPLPPLPPLLEESAPEGALLTPLQLRTVALWGKTGERSAACIHNCELDLRLIFASLGKRCSIPRELYQPIIRSINPEGEIDDRADPELRKIRTEIRRASAALSKSLASMLHSPALKDSLQEKIVTLRDGRYVLPVKAGKRGKVEGIMHGKSSSGETMYIEPSAAVEQNNYITSLHLDEKAAITRILKNLTSLIRNASATLRDMHSALLAIDEYTARAKFSRMIAGRRPLFGERFHLRQARHPLLQVEPVPIDIDFCDKRIMVITGPNTGGKTVSLKTAGLLTLLARGGFHIPADENSSIPFFTDILCDIGDEQSINRNLSTFSGHMMNLKEIINNASENCLVLIDEPGAGTDPSEGAALARAILEEMVESGAAVLATTHYNELKYFAHEHEQIISASVAFDPKSLKPLYRLLPGQPGSSRALQIAETLGIPESVISRAEELLDGDALNIEKLLIAIQEQLGETERIKAEAEQSRRIAEEQKIEYEKKNVQLGEQQKQLIVETREKLDIALRDFRSRSDSFMKELRSSQHIPDAREESEWKKRRNELSEAALAALPATDELKGEPVKPLEGGVQVGDLVLIETMQKKGRVLEIMNRGKKVLVQLGRTRTAVPASEVMRLEGPVEQTIHSRVQTVTREVSSTLDVRGRRFEEASALVRAFLDDCCTCGLTRVTIIHGKGSGSLQRATKETLEEHPHVAAFHFSAVDAGGTGSTVAELK